MVKHIVMWKVTEGCGTGGGQANALRVKRALESLRGRVPGLITIEVGLGRMSEDGSSNVVLYSEFESAAALEAYREHPAHSAVLPIVKAVCTDRRSVDYET